MKKNRDCSSLERIPSSLAPSSQSDVLMAGTNFSQAERFIFSAGLA